MALLGFYSSVTSGQALKDCGQYLKINTLPLQVQFLDSTQSWSSGMWSSYYINTCSSAVKAVMTIPMLVGSSTGTPLTGSGSGQTLSPQGPADTIGTGTSATLTISASSGSGYTFSYNSGAASTITFPYNPSAAQVTASLNSTAGVSGATATLSGTGAFLLSFPASSSITISNLSTTVSGTLTADAVMTLADVGNGIWDNMFKKVFQTISAARPACILRIGWEMYGNAGFYPWSGPSLASQHQAAWIDLVTLARSVSSSFQFDWNGGVTYAGYSPWIDGAWPGAQYVDYFLADVYENQGGNRNGSSNWNVIAASLAPGMAFAQSEGLPFSMPEFGLWGVNGSYWGDDPAWIEAAYYWMRQNASYLGYVPFYNGSTSSSTNLVNCPNSAAVFSSLFGGWARAQSGDALRFVTAGTNRFRVV